MWRVMAGFILLGVFLTISALEGQQAPALKIDAFGDPLPAGALARIGTTRLRHQGAIAALAWSQDGTALASASHDRTVCFWDAKSGKLVRRFDGHDGAVFALALSEDGKLLATGGQDKTVGVWQIASGKLVWKSDGHKEPVYCLAFSPDATLLSSGGHDAKVRLWDAVTGKELRQFADAADDTPMVLESDKFAVRQKATNDLKKMGAAAEPVLNLLLEGKPTLVLRLRVEPLLEAVAGAKLSPDRVRTVRALEVLERIGNNEARMVLETLAKGAPGAWLTRQAQGCVQRLEQLRQPNKIDPLE
jgi:hypothetical protein